MSVLVLNSQSPIREMVARGGGKAKHLALLSQAGYPVPEWFCVGSDVFDEFVKAHGFVWTNDTIHLAQNQILAAAMPAKLADTIWSEVERSGLSGDFLAVRSSGLDEDSKDHSFAGQFSSYLFQKGREAVLKSVQACWASGFSERVIAYRREKSLQLDRIQIGVVIQRMINAQSAGVAFSRNPIHPMDRENLVISSVWGMGEGLVSGELDADHFEVNRKTFEVKSKIAPKTHAVRQAPSGGIRTEDLELSLRDQSSLTDAQIRELAVLTLRLEADLGCPQDCEWVVDRGKIYLVQTRPITSLPIEAFYDPKINGKTPILWDNSNIIESYCGVTTPLTFSHASRAYREVYDQFCQIMGVPKPLILAAEPVFRNMLGLIRGRIYYNLINWYRLIFMFPWATNNKAFMETMMGVKQGLKPEVEVLFEFLKTPIRYAPWTRIYLSLMLFYRCVRVGPIVREFQSHVGGIYEKSRRMDFTAMPFDELVSYYQYLIEKIVKRWQAPIINDTRCMIFFGLLKKLTEKWVAVEGTDAGSLQNDLLCGQGDLESTEPTKMLMRIADHIDHDRTPGVKAWFVARTADQVWGDLIQTAAQPELKKQLDEFLDRYGFRSVNELKLEEPDLHDNPAFVIEAIGSYVRMKTYSIHAMEERESAIRKKAEALVNGRLSGPRKWFYFWIVQQARNSVRDRENLRFMRTRTFGLTRNIFRAMGLQLKRLGFLDDPADVFYLTIDELMEFNEGRVMTSNYRELTRIRRQEFDRYRNTPQPPDRFLTYGTAGVSFSYAQVLADSDLLRGERPQSDDPSLLFGTACCPGVVEGEVRVVSSMDDAKGLSGQILVTERTDPGWVPLYPSCSGLLIERGSLLSHSAVVARELGLPTIVGISGGLMQKLKTGQRVRMDAGKGEIRILD